MPAALPTRHTPPAPAASNPARLFLVPRSTPASNIETARPGRHRRLVDVTLLVLGAILTLTPAIAIYRQPAPSPRVYPPHHLAITAALDLPSHLNLS